MRWKILVIILVGLVGAYFLGKGITGLVVSPPESCCFGPGCSADHLCGAAKLQTESPDRIGGFDLLVGSTVLMAVIALGYNEWQLHHKHK